MKKLPFVLSLVCLAASALAHAAAPVGDGPFVHFAPTEPDALPLRALQFLGGKPAVDIAVDPVTLRHDVSSLSGALPVALEGFSTRIPERNSEAGLARARAWLKAQYQAIGFTVHEQGGWGGTNFIAEKPGTDPNLFVIVSSHLDAVENVPGADDDASGTISALAIARALAPHTFRYGLRIVAFDKEEDGLVGSGAYVDHLQEQGTVEEILAVLHLEMTGYDPGSRGNFHSIDCNKRTSMTLSSLVMESVQVLRLPLHRVSGCTNRSDHASFWGAGVPAIVVSENFFGGGGNPCYHSACDTADRLNYDYMAAITRAVGRAASALMEPLPF